MSLSETNNPLISVIINCYNGEKFLKKSIESVINQTYSNWEIIFWDNLSNDNSKKIVNHYTDKRIKYFGAKNFTKLYEARNLAIEKASGEYIAFLDVDDWWTNNKQTLTPIASQAHTEQIQPARMCLTYADYELFSSIPPADNEQLL